MPGPVQNPMTESKESTIAKAETWQCCGFTQASDAKSCIECGAPRKATGENKEDARKRARKKRNEYKKEFPKGTPLVCACQVGRFDDVKLLITGHDVKATGVTVKEMVYQEGRDRGGSEATPLMVAGRHRDIVDYLFAILLDGIAEFANLYRDIDNANTLTDVYKKALPKSQWTTDFGPLILTPLVCACHFGRLEDVKLLITGHDVKATGVTVKEMVNRKGKHTSSNKDFTPLGAATDQAVVDYLFAILLDPCIKINASTLFGEYKKLFPTGTPLVCACEKGRLDHVKLLIAGHDVNQVGNNSSGFGWIPLIVAAYHERLDIVQHLIEQCGADPNCADPGHSGKNALHYAAQNNKKNTDLIQLLLNHMTIDSINKIARFATPLDCAIKQESIDLIRSKGGKRNTLKKAQKNRQRQNNNGGGCCIIS